MPELPEIETLRQHLSSEIVGYAIRKVTVIKPRIVRPESPHELENAIKGRSIAHIHRRGKYLLLEFTHKKHPQKILVHLGMTGRLFS